MLEPAWYTKEATEANIMAVLKRTHIIPAPSFIPLGDKTEFLAEPYRPVYDFYRKGGSSTPANMQEKLAWEEKWMTAALNGKKGDELPRRAIILGPALFGDRPSSSDAAAGKTFFSACQHSSCSQCISFCFAILCLFQAQSKRSICIYIQSTGSKHSQANLIRSNTTRLGWHYRDL